jgi:V/A-type H+-transporting ATPase subunit D
MKLDVSPTRMELLKLRKKLSIAQRGHKLLKDKLDEFVRQLLILVKELGELRAIIDEKYALANRYFNVANASTFPEATIAALSSSNMKLSLETSFQQLLNIKVPRFNMISQDYDRSYAFVQTSIGLDMALDIFSEVMKSLIVLAEKEKAVQMIADEIQKTRRRVNALEYILIPNIEETIKYITMKLDENERNNQTQLMRVKDIVRAPKSQSSAYAGSAKYPF